MPKPFKLSEDSSYHYSHSRHLKDLMIQAPYSSLMVSTISAVESTVANSVIIARVVS
jgi:hypothetical protein